MIQVSGSPKDMIHVSGSPQDIVHVSGSPQDKDVCLDHPGT